MEKRILRSKAVGVSILGNVEEVMLYNGGDGDPTIYPEIIKSCTQPAAIFGQHRTIHRRPEPSFDPSENVEVLARLDPCIQSRGLFSPTNRRRLLMYWSNGRVIASIPACIGRHNWRAYRREAQFGCGVRYVLFSVFTREMPQAHKTVKFNVISFRLRRALCPSPSAAKSGNYLSLTLCLVPRPLGRNFFPFRGFYVALAAVFSSAVWVRDN
jgi:hypothetical protein